jgi:hypothetical protein
MAKIDLQNLNASLNHINERRVMMKDYYQRSMKALQLAGMSDRTQESYTRSIRMLVDFYGKTPDRITETGLEYYFLHRRNVDKWSPATMRICYSGIKFFFINVLKRDWHTLSLMYANMSLCRYRPLNCCVSTGKSIRTRF